MTSEAKEIVSTITSKGQVTVPVQIRKQLGLVQGGKVSFVIDENGLVALRVPRYADVASVVGAAGTLDKPLSYKEVREIARQDRLKRHQRG